MTFSSQNVPPVITSPSVLHLLDAYLPGDVVYNTTVTDVNAGLNFTYYITSA